MNEIQMTQADRLKQLHGEIIGAARMLLDKAIEAGAILQEVKAALPHGEFTPWVEAFAGFNIRTAQRYMKIHENREELKNDSVSFLTDAHRLLTTSKPEVEPLRINEETKLRELEAVIEKNLRILADSDLYFGDLISYFGLTLDEFLDVLPLMERESKDKLILNLKEIRSLVDDLYKREGWKALGYKSWQECVVAEFKAK